MCRPRNIAMRDYQKSVTIGQTHRRSDRQTPDKEIPMCRYASQATQKQPTCYYQLDIKFFCSRSAISTGDRQDILKTSGCQW